MKECSRCGAVKPISEMTKRHNRPGSWCLSCHCEREREKRAEARASPVRKCRLCGDCKPREDFLSNRAGFLSSACAACVGPAKPRRVRPKQVRKPKASAQRPYTPDALIGLLAHLPAINPPPLRWHA